MENRKPDGCAQVTVQIDMADSRTESLWNHRSTGGGGLMELYSYRRSSSSWRVRIALRYKRLPFVLNPVHLRDGAQRTLEHRLRNPLGQVPVLILKDQSTLTQSMAILEYLEERHPTPALLPSDPFLRARVRQLAEVINSAFSRSKTLRCCNVCEPIGWRCPYLGESPLQKAWKPWSGWFEIHRAPTWPVHSSVWRTCCWFPKCTMPGVLAAP